MASTDPAAADHALTGSVPLAELRSFSLLSDGATRLADLFTALTWQQLDGILRDHGPHELIRRTREAEDNDPHGRHWPRTKAHDDATAVHCNSGAALGDSRPPRATCRVHPDRDRCLPAEGTPGDPSTCQLLAAVPRDAARNGQPRRTVSCVNFD